MFLSSQSTPVPFPSMSYIDSSTVRSQQTNPISLPKYFNVSYAIQNGYFRCVRYLLELSHDPNERDGQLRTPLILCSYVENDRWSLSLAQNLLEKGAKIALEDHARRNAMHHACALQRIHLVQLYLSCLDFNIEAKDCEGNTCLHYVAITGNCEIAELLIKSAEKMGIRLDQYINREGCSAAILALKYGHIECANQITLRDPDEFFLVPRPLSIYETPPTTDDNHNLNTTSKKKNKITSQNSSTTKNDIRPSTFSFGLLKIIFNDSDSGYSTHLAGLCDEKTPHRRCLRHKKQQTSQKMNKFDQTKLIIPNNTQYSSTEALVNQLQLSAIDEEYKKNLDDNEDINNTIQTSPHVQLLIQQNFSNENNLLSNNENKFKTSIPTIYRPTSNSTINQIEPPVPLLSESARTNNKFQRPKTAAIITRNQTSVNAIGIPSRLSSPKIQQISSYKKSKKKSLLNNRPNSASIVSKQHLNLIPETITYSQTLYAGRPLSAVLQNYHRHPPVQRTVDSSCTIREAKSTTNRYNKPEELFGLKPEELFGLSNHQSKKTNDHTRLKRQNLQKQEYIWQQDIDKLVDLYNIHHCSNYRPTAVPPPRQILVQTNDLTHSGKTRRMSGAKNSSNIQRSPRHSKQSTLASLNIPRRNSISRRSSIKLTNT